MNRSLFRKVITGSVVALGLIAIVGCGNDDNGTNGRVRNGVTATISQDPEFSILDSALRAAGLINQLNGAGPYTVFAPTDEAFNALPNGVLDSLFANPAELQRVLSYHVVRDSLPSDTLESTQYETLTGDSITVAVNGENVVVNGTAEVVRPDLQAENGVVHGINSVLLPPEEDDNEEDETADVE